MFSYLQTFLPSTWTTMGAVAYTQVPLSSDLFTKQRPCPEGGSTGTRRCRNARACDRGTASPEVRQEAVTLRTELLNDWIGLTGDERIEKADRLVELSMCKKDNDKGRRDEVSDKMIQQREQEEQRATRRQPLPLMQQQQRQQDGLHQNQQRRPANPPAPFAAPLVIAQPATLLQGSRTNGSVHGFSVRSRTPPPQQASPVSRRQGSVASAATFTSSRTTFAGSTRSLTASPARPTDAERIRELEAEVRRLKKKVTSWERKSEKWWGRYQKWKSVALQFADRVERAAEAEDVEDGEESDGDETEVEV